jgi:PEP-CTERM motif-containing protein
MTGQRARFVAVFVGLVLVAAPASATSLILNGDFEALGGSLTGWTVLNQAGGSGNWFLQSGTTSPTNGTTVPAPPGPTHAAMTDQTGPGSHLLYQDFLVPFGVGAAELAFDLFIGNRNGTFFTPASLNYVGSGSNQQARVDIIRVAADPFSVAAADVLLNLYQTMVGDPAVSGYTGFTFNLASFLSAHEGETLRLRFAEVDNQFFFQAGVDRVRLDVSEVPEPATLLLIGTGLACAARRRQRRSAGQTR